MFGMFGVPVKMLEMFWRASITFAPVVVATSESPVAIHEHIARTRAWRNGRDYGTRSPKADAKRNTRCGKHRAARQKQTR